jgi:hypothetical protein
MSGGAWFALLAPFTQSCGCLFPPNLTPVPSLGIQTQGSLTLLAPELHRVVRSHHAAAPLSGIPECFRKLDGCIVFP